MWKCSLSLSLSALNVRNKTWRSKRYFIVVASREREIERELRIVYFHHGLCAIVHCVSVAIKACVRLILSIFVVVVRVSTIVCQHTWLFYAISHLSPYTPQYTYVDDACIRICCVCVCVCVPLSVAKTMSMRQESLDFYHLLHRQVEITCVYSLTCCTRCSYWLYKYTFAPWAVFFSFSLLYLNFSYTYVYVYSTQTLRDSAKLSTHTQHTRSPFLELHVGFCF